MIKSCTSVRFLSSSRTRQYRKPTNVIISLSRQIGGLQKLHAFKQDGCNKGFKTAMHRSHLIRPGPMCFPQQLQVVELPKSPSTNIIFHSQDLRGSRCWTIAALLHNGHSGFSRTQSPIHVQQKTWPHWVAAGSFNSSKHNVHFLCCWPLIQPITFSSFRWYLGSANTGVYVSFSIFDLDKCTGPVSVTSSLLVE